MENFKSQSLKSAIDNAVKDPITCCKVYKEIGCSHIDGFLCNINTCSILCEYKKN